MRRAVILAPYWVSEKYVGNKRLNYFLEWLVEAGYEVVLVSSCANNLITKDIVTEEICVKDPFKIYSRDDRKRKKSKLRSIIFFVVKKLVYKILVPDPLILWSYRVVNCELVRSKVQGASLVLSSSPPESVHCAAIRLGRMYKVPVYVDMRDGWLDEPLKKPLKGAGFQRWREGRIEKKILLSSRNIFVTSDGWKKVLAERIPEVGEKIVTLLTPARERQKHNLAERDVGLDTGRNLKLCYAGRFTGSSSSRKASLLFDRLYNGLKSSGAYGEIDIIGDLEACDIREIKDFAERYSKSGWNIRLLNSVLPGSLSGILEDMDGFLMLSTSRYAIPSKFGTYLSVGRPILVFTYGDSEIWDLYNNIRGVYTVDIDAEGTMENINSISEFVEGCKQKLCPCCLPEEFTEEHAKKTFFRQLTG